MMSALHLVSAPLSKLWIIFVNCLLDADLYKYFFDFRIFFLFWISVTILSYTFMLHKLGQTLYIKDKLVIFFADYTLKIDEKDGLGLIGGFDTI